MPCKNADDFPGLYIDALSPSTFLMVKDREFLLTHTYWRSNKMIIAVDLASNNLYQLKSSGSWSMLWAGNGLIVAAWSAPITPNELVGVCFSLSSTYSFYL